MLIITQTALELGVDPARCYADYREMAEKEAARDDGIDFVVVVTPNVSHYEICKAFLNAGIHVSCDKPVTVTYAQAAELEALAQSEGNLRVHAMLQEIDPKAAGQIHPNNIKRVIRAIEYFRQTGEQISVHNEAERGKQSPYHFLYYAVTTDRSLLYRRIDSRVDQMMENGLVEEVRRLKERGCHRGLTSMQGLGYKEILDYLNGACTLEEAVYVLKRDTRHFAKRQLTWFKRERDVRFLNLPDFENDPDRVLRAIIEDCVAEKIVLQ